MKCIAILFGCLLVVRAQGADPAELSAKIDRHIGAGWKANGVPPAPPADDAEFLRRAYLDLAGRIPRVQQVRDFLSDARADKRRKVVQQLLDGTGYKESFGNGSGYAQHFATIWRREWLPQTVSNPQFQFFGVQFEQWLREVLRKNTTYDKLVRALLTSPPFGVNDGRAFDANSQAMSAFIQVNEVKPENVAAAASRLFLGVKLECAQCHDHPFETYKRTQFWEFATFFAGLQPVNPRTRRTPAEAIEIRSLTIPGTETKVTPRFLNGKEPTLEEKVSPRVTLVDWMTAKDNPYFARNAVNRIWANFFGVGLIDPLDEPGEKNPPSHPELLDDLARSFADSGYDLKYLIKAIVGSRAYQLSSAGGSSSESHERTFARLRVRGLTPEQLFDSLVTATYFRDEPLAQRQFVGPNTPRGEFLARFATSERLSESQTSILQALTLMNGKFVADMTSLDVNKSNLLLGTIDSPFLDDRQKIETLFLATVSRYPRESELRKLQAYVAKGGASEDSKKAFADIFWALLNSSEFAFNH